MPSRFSPGVLPDYYGGNPTDTIADALYKRQQQIQSTRNAAALYGPAVLPKSTGIFGSTIGGDPYSALRPDASMGAPSGSETTPGATTGADQSGASASSGSGTPPIVATRDTVSPPPQASPSLGNQTQSGPGMSGQMQAGGIGQGFADALTRQRIARSASPMPAAPGSVTIGRGGLSEAMNSGAGSNTAPNVLHTGKPKEFNPATGTFNDVNGQPSQPPAPPPVPQAPGQPAQTPVGQQGAPPSASSAPSQPPSGSPQQGAPQGQDPNSRIIAALQNVASKRALTPAEQSTMKLAQSLQIEPQKLQAEQLENGLSRDSNGNLTYNPERDPKIMAARETGRIQSELQLPRLMLEQRKQDLDQQIANTKAGIERDNLARERDMLQFQIGKFGEEQGLSESTHYGQSIEDESKWANMYNTQWKPAYDQARGIGTPDGKPNPTALEPVLMSFAMGSDTQSGQLRAGIAKVLGIDSSPDKSWGQGFMDEVHRKLVSGMSDKTLAGMGQLMDTEATARAQLVGARYRDAIGRTPEMTRYTPPPSKIFPGMLDDGGNYVAGKGSSRGGASAAPSNTRVITQDEWNENVKTYGEAYMKQHFTVGTAPK